MQNCGLDDDEFSVILEGLCHLKEFKSLSYIQNNFGESSLENCSDLLKRKCPNQLDDLQIINCKIDGKISSELID